MDWASFSLGALASLAIFLVTDASHSCPECAQRAQRGERDAWDWVNAEQFRKMIEAADERFLKLYRRYVRLKTAAQKFRDAVSAQDGATTLELDAALSEQPEPEPGANP